VTTAAIQPATTETPAIVPPNPFERRHQERDTLAAGAVAIEQERAIAEAQGKLVLAKRFPRDQFAAFDRAMQACQRKGLADEAFYTYPRGGQSVSGPSIRLAEELARCWGNVEYGLRELSNREGVSEMEAYCWDLESNVSSKQQFTVRHLRDKRGGAEALTDQRDIYEIAANMGARRMRARILAILPADYVDAAVQRCRQTLAEGGKNEPMAVRVQKMLQAFAAHHVNAKHLEEWLGHPLDKMTPEKLVELQGIFNALRDGRAKVADYFGVKLEAPKEAPKGVEVKSTTANAPAQQGTPVGQATAEKPPERRRAKKNAVTDVKEGETEEQAMAREAAATTTTEPAKVEQFPKVVAPTSAPAATTTAQGEDLF
jgi:hypothetical protein